MQCNVITNLSLFQNSGLCIQETNNFRRLECDFELSFLLFNLRLHYLSYIWLAFEIIILRKQAFDKKVFYMLFKTQFRVTT